MEDVMGKVVGLYNALQEKSAAQKGKDQDLLARETKVSDAEKALKADRAELAKDRKAVKEVTDVVALKKEVAASYAEMKVEKGQLQKDRDEFDAYKKLKMKEIDGIRQEADDINTEVKATRARLLVEVDRVAKEKENYKADVLADLAGRS